MMGYVRSELASTISKIDAETDYYAEMKFSHRLSPRPKSETSTTQKLLRHKITILNRQRHILVSVLDQLRFDNVTVDQLMLLKRCEAFNERYRAHQALALLASYNAISSEFGISPDHDRQEIMGCLIVLRDEILSQAEE